MDGWMHPHARWLEGPCALESVQDRNTNVWIDSKWWAGDMHWSEPDPCKDHCMFSVCFSFSSFFFPLSLSLSLSPPPGFAFRVAGALF